MVNKHIYSTQMYISLLINVSVSLMISGNEDNCKLAAEKFNVILLDPWQFINA